MNKKQQILEMASTNITQREMAKRIGCSEDYVSRVLKRNGLSRKIENEYIGVQFNDLIPIKFLGRDKRSHILFLCKCRCGKTKKVRGNDLRQDTIKSCGCRNHKTGKDHAGFKGYEDIPSTYWTRLQSNAEKRNLDFNLTIEEAWELFIQQKRRCSLSGVLLDFSTPRQKSILSQASLDRIDSSKGYIKGNVQWVCKETNFMKRDMTDEEFINWCNAVSSFQKSKNKGLL